MALAQLLQPWADEYTHYGSVALKNQGGGQYSQERVVIRHQSPEARAKLVRHDFTQAIDTHWRKRALEWNRIGDSSGIWQ